MLLKYLTIYVVVIVQIVGFWPFIYDLNVKHLTWYHRKVPLLALFIYTVGWFFYIATMLSSGGFDHHTDTANIIMGFYISFYVIQFVSGYIIQYFNLIKILVFLSKARKLFLNINQSVLTTTYTNLLCLFTFKQFLLLLEVYVEVQKVILMIGHSRSYAAIFLRHFRNS